MNALPRAALALAAIAVLCLLAYWRALSLPLISDDYLQVGLSRDYGPVSGWGNLAADALYRCRATSLFLTYWTERCFGFSPFVFNVSSLIVHILNSWMVLALGTWRIVGWRVSFFAACFFAVYQGHQEAVMWYAALPELLVFLFAMACLLFWIRWLQSVSTGKVWYAASLICYVLALFSKESAVAVVPLLGLALCLERTGWKRRLLALVPFAVLAVLYFAMIYATRDQHQFFHDGTFSVHGPFWLVVPFSFGRLLWIWGLLSLLALLYWRARQFLTLIWVASAWIVVTLLPYSMLTYMSRVPSRHTYFASAGLALIVGAAFLTFRERARTRTWAVGGLACLIIVHHCVYLWTKKQNQYLVRAAPTEVLLQRASHADGAILLGCFPYDRSVAVAAVGVRYGPHTKVVFGGSGGLPEPEALDLCSASLSSSQQ